MLFISLIHLLESVSTVKGTGVTAIKASAGCVWRPKMTNLNNVSKDNNGPWVSKRGNPQQDLKNKGIFDSGCSRHITGNKAFLTDYQELDGGFVAFGGSAKEIRHHFIRDSYEKRLIEMVQIHTDNNIADLLTKAFDGRLMVYKCSGLYTSAIWIEVGSVERPITTAASLDAAQDNDNIIRTQATTMPNVGIPQGVDTNGSPRRQDTIGGAPAQTRSERMLEKPNETPLSEGHTSGSGEGSMENHFELMDNVPPTPHDSPLSGCYTPGSDEGSSSCGDPQTKEKSQEIRKTKEFKYLITKKEEIQTVHNLFMDGIPMKINMLVEKKYPLIKELLEKMLSLQLEAEEESTMAFELIKFIKSMLE
ncbi:hypothetical protein Tco_0475648 [Tanacetum coccineum]